MNLPEGPQFRPAELERLRDAGTALAGRIAIGHPGMPSLYRRVVGRLWPEVVTLGTGESGSPEPAFRFAVDGYVVADGRLSLGTGEPSMRLAATFRASPDAFMARLDNACCNIVAHDRSRGVTIIANDPIGCLPLFLHRGGDVITFANDLPGLKAISPPLERDPVGCAELYWFGYQIANRTIYRDVICIPPGVVICIDWRTGAITTEQWARPPERSAPEPSRDAAVDLVEAMRTACRRLYVPERRYAIKLSGGMDSRLIAGCWPEPGLRGFTFAAPGSVEGKLTGRLAKALAMPLEVIPISGDFFTRMHAPIFAKYAITEYFHQAMIAPMARAGIDCALDGLAGDVLFGGLALKRKGGMRAALRNALGRAGPSLPADASSQAAAEMIFSQIRVSDANLPVLHDAAQREIEAQRPEVLADIAQEYESCDPGEAFDRRYIRFAIRNRMRRHVALQGAICRPDVETLYPFLDRDVQAMAGRIDTAEIAGKQFYRRLYRENLPRIAGVPFVDSLLPPSAPNPWHVLGRIMRYGMETIGYRASLKLQRDLPYWRINCVQWPRWIAFDRDFIAGIQRFMAQSPAFDNGRFEAAIDRVRRGAALTGTRMMLTASFLGLSRIFPS